MAEGKQSRPQAGAEREWRAIRGLGLLLLVLVALRLVTMALLPMSDTTEPRYAEIARLMAERGDWITPWFTPEQPFWGKPPLSFWAQAASMRLFGTNDFSARLPSWLAMAAVLWLTMRLARSMGYAAHHGADRPACDPPAGGSAGDPLAIWSALILATMVLPYVSAGAVMTDPFLALGTTLALASAWIAVHEGSRVWGWAVFAGLSIGLLAKGPVAAVIVAVPVAAWGVWGGHWGKLASSLPWTGGLALTATLVLPWYVLAELKTPGFLDYFIVGEHLRRFTQPGWAGDLYGTAHLRPRGTIWPFMLMAAFPWSLVGLAWLAWLAAGLRHRGGRARLAQGLNDDATRWLLSAALVSPLFFTASRNILWTYALPSLPFVAIGIARLLAADGGPTWPRAAVAAALAVPLVLTVGGVVLSTRPEALETALPLLRALQAQPNGTPERLVFLGRPPFSATYYSRGAVGRIEPADLPVLAERARTEPVFLALRPVELAEAQKRLGVPVQVVWRGSQYLLLRASQPGGSGDGAARTMASPGRPSSE
jgi:4-amino-4-deoxy-L-arabinose transferase-like glycosyltransferase